MWGLLKTKVNLGFLINPFYLYCIAFSLAIITYLLGWSMIFPRLSSGLILFFAITFILFIFAGYILVEKPSELTNKSTFRSILYDITFWLIILLGLINVLYMGYLPILDRSYDYREFGMPVIDPLFNTLSIFFSVFFFRSYLTTKKKKEIIYLFIILIIQLLLFRRSTLVWIITSSSFLFLLYKRQIRLIIILAGIICIPFVSYSFGLYGNTRSKLTKSFVLNDLGASDVFKRTGISHNHYMTYLYVSSPLANLQENIDHSKENFKSGDFKKFLFYCIIPESVTKRLEKTLNLLPPSCILISPYLIAGSFYMVSFCLMGWTGMIIMFLFLFTFILLCLYVINKWDTFGLETFSLLSATVSLLIFSDFLNRLDVILILFVYPVLFHFIFIRINKRSESFYRVPSENRDKFKLNTK